MYATDQGMQAAQTMRDHINGANKIAEPPRRPELAEQIDKLEKALSFAEESVGELSARLGGVVRPPAPEPTTAAGGSLAMVGPSTHYGQQVHDFYHRAGRLGERVQDLLRRLEV